EQKFKTASRRVECAEGHGSLPVILEHIDGPVRSGSDDGQVLPVRPGSIHQNPLAFLATKEFRYLVILALLASTRKADRETGVLAGVQDDAAVFLRCPDDRLPASGERVHPDKLGAGPLGGPRVPRQHEGELRVVIQRVEQRVYLVADGLV